MIHGNQITFRGKADAGCREAPTSRFGFGVKILDTAVYSSDAAHRSFLLISIVACSYLRLYQNVFQSKKNLYSFA